MKKIVAGLVTASILLSLSPNSKAVNLEGKIGVGYSDCSPLPGWSLRYWLCEALAVNGIIGFHLETDKNTFLLGGRIIYKVKDWNNLNLYLGGEIGGSWLQDPDNNFSVGPFVGAEYFFAGLPNLGFEAEFGPYYESAHSAYCTLSGGLAVHYYWGGAKEKKEKKEEKPAK
jgi:hypothetical protein